MLTAHYSTLLFAHNLLRWFVLLAGIAVLIGCLIGILHKRPFKPAGRVLGLIYVSLLDLQVLCGILLSVASPLVCAFWSHPGVGMKSHELRYFAIEHASIMIIALALAHVGAVRSRRATIALHAYTNALFCYAASLVVMLAGIPWGRPLLKL